MSKARRGNGLGVWESHQIYQKEMQEYIKTLPTKEEVEEEYKQQRQAMKKFRYTSGKLDNIEFGLHGNAGEAMDRNRTERLRDQGYLKGPAKLRQEERQTRLEQKSKRNLDMSIRSATTSVRDALRDLYGDDFPDDASENSFGTMETVVVTKERMLYEKPPLQIGPILDKAWKIGDPIPFDPSTAQQDQALGPAWERIQNKEKPVQVEPLTAVFGQYVPTDKSSVIGLGGENNILEKFEHKERLIGIMQAIDYVIQTEKERRKQNPQGNIGIRSHNAKYATKILQETKERLLRRLQHESFVRKRPEEESTVDPGFFRRWKNKIHDKYKGARRGIRGICGKEKFIMDDDSVTAPSYTWRQRFQMIFKTVRERGVRESFRMCFSHARITYFEQVSMEGSKAAQLHKKALMVKASVSSIKQMSVKQSARKIKVNRVPTFAKGLTHKALAKHNAALRSDDSLKYRKKSGPMEAEDKSQENSLRRDRTQSDLGSENGQMSEDQAKAILQSFYRVHNPGKLKNIDKFLQKYHGRYELMFAEIQKKYPEATDLPSSPALLNKAQHELLQQGGDSSPSHTKRRPQTTPHISTANTPAGRRRRPQTTPHNSTANTPIGRRPYTPKEPPIGRQSHTSRVQEPKEPFDPLAYDKDWRSKRPLTASQKVIKKAVSFEEGVLDTSHKALKRLDSAQSAVSSVLTQRAALNTALSAVERAENINKKMMKAYYKKRGVRDKLAMSAGGAGVATLRAVESVQKKRDKQHAFTANDLVHAAHDGNVELVLAVLAQPEKAGLVEVDDYNDDGTTAIMAAFQFLLNLDDEVRVARKKRKEKTTKKLKKRVKKYENLIDLLMHKGASVDLKEKVGNFAGGAEHEFTMLHYAAKAGNMKRLKWLVETAAVKINVEDERGLTPLMLCCQSRFPKEMCYLLSWDMDPNVADKQGCTALHYAAIAGSVMTKVLLYAMADKTLKDLGGKIASDYAKERKKMITYQILQTFEKEHIPGKEYLDYLQSGEDQRESSISTYD